MPRTLLAPEALDAIALAADALRKRLYERTGNADASAQLAAAIMPTIVSARMKGLVQMPAEDTRDS